MYPVKVEGYWKRLPTTYYEGRLYVAPNYNVKDYQYRISDRNFNVSEKYYGGRWFEEKTHDNKWTRMERRLHEEKRLELSNIEHLRNDERMIWYKNQIGVLEVSILNEYSNCNHCY